MRPAEFDKHQPQVVVGSTRGEAVEMNIHSGGLSSSALIEVGYDHRLANPKQLAMMFAERKQYESARTVRT